VVLLLLVVWNDQHGPPRMTTIAAAPISSATPTTLYQVAVSSSARAVALKPAALAKAAPRSA
jgi:hypothetical protein